MLTDQEREIAVGLLNRSRQTLLDAVDGVTEEQARWKPAPERWSILEYAEHLAVSETGLLELVKKILRDDSHPETEEDRRAREKKIRETPMPRGVNRAPDALHPNGRFPTLKAATQSFLEAREGTLEFAHSTQDDLRSRFAPHSVLGPMDGYQWLVANARHAENHAGHIREIRGRL